MKQNKGFEKLGQLIGSGRRKKPPAFPWQDLALRVITELSIPEFKRSAVFKVCRDNPRVFIEKCLNDTKELCHTGQCWKYFFKLTANK